MKKTTQTAVLLIILVGTALLIFGEKVLAPAETSINNGERFGLIRAVEQNNAGAVITIDEIEFLSGEAAVRAVMEDFNCPQNKVAECAPSMNNDFYLRNTDKTTRNYNITSSSAIKIFHNP